MDLKENTGAIFKNERKQEDKHPDYRGQINVNGQVKDIALWMRKSEGGKPYFSVMLTEPYKAPVKDASDEPTDSLPF